MKKIISAMVLTAFVTPAFASIESVITGADMAGIEVTATFDGGLTETLVWAVTDTDATVPFGEGFAGGVSSANFSLNQQGFTEGNIDPLNNVLGLWTLENTFGADLLSLQIDALAGGIVFDIVDATEETVGSGNGREFLTDGPIAGLNGFNYSGLYSGSDLYGELTLEFAPGGFAGGRSFSFLADTDAISVAEPSTIALLALGLSGLIFSRKRQQKS